MSAHGTVVWFNARFGYGFIRVAQPTSPDAFFHHTDLPEADYRTIKRGARVRFTLAHTRLGPVAHAVTPL